MAVPFSSPGFQILRQLCELALYPLPERFVVYLERQPHLAEHHFHIGDFVNHISQEQQIEKVFFAILNGFDFLGAIACRV
jgi:hypothetical protein